jgi:hypothetical protein
MTITQEEALQIAYDISSKKPSLKKQAIKAGLFEHESDIDFTQHPECYSEGGII